MKTTSFVRLQEKLVLKDFDIEHEAGGTGKPIIKKITVAVTSHTLKIHFYWAGRGTTGIPLRGNYGPLISAISVDPSKFSLVVTKIGIITCSLLFLDEWKNYRRPSTFPFSSIY